MRVRWKDFELPTRVTRDEKTATPTYASFSAEPFERGFATTIGNSLRRVLYSSIEGTAVTAVKIKGDLAVMEPDPDTCELVVVALYKKGAATVAGKLRELVSLKGGTYAVAA